MVFEKIMKYKLPVKIDRETKKFIEQSFFSAAEEMDEEEFNYINRKINQKLEVAKKATISWVSELSSYYNVLYEAFVKDDHKSSEATKLIGAALFYFINPFDIIPDDTPDIGYVDDFFVLITCLKSLAESDREIVKRYFDKTEL